MRTFRLLFLRRLIAACLAVSLGFFSAESLTAEVHDGDATHAELVRADGAREHGAAHRAALVAEAAPEGLGALSTASAAAAGTLADGGGAVALDHATFEHVTPASAVSAPRHTHGPPSHDAGAPEHAAHVCHCGHGHVAPLSLAAVPPRPAFGVQVPGPADEPAVPLWRAGEPALRPPIG